MEPAYVLLLIWVVGVLDQANEYRIIRKSRTHPDMTPERWVLRRRTARWSLICTFITLAVVAYWTRTTLIPVAAWCVFAAGMWVVADLATDPNRHPSPPTMNADPSGAK